MISSKTKNEYKEKLSQKYSKRKFFNIITLVLLVCYIALIIITFFVSGSVGSSPIDIYGENKIMGLYLSPYAWSMLFIGIALFIMQIVSIVLIWTSIDPRTASKMQREVSAREREQRMKTKIYNAWQSKQAKTKKNKSNKSNKSKSKKRK